MWHFPVYWRRQITSKPRLHFALQVFCEIDYSRDFRLSGVSAKEGFCTQGMVRARLWYLQHIPSRPRGEIIPAGDVMGYPQLCSTDVDHFIGNTSLVAPSLIPGDTTDPLKGMTARLGGRLPDVWISSVCSSLTSGRTCFACTPFRMVLAADGPQLCKPVQRAAVPSGP
jgi:hypothetical protein